MTKADFIREIREELGDSITNADIGRVLDAAGCVAEGILAQGNDVPLPGLGSLKPVTRRAREGRNPRTGKALKIPAKKTVKFAASKALKEALN